MRRVDVGKVERSPAERAGLLLASWNGLDCVLLDAGRNRFVRAPESPAGAEAAIGLSWDGTEVVYRGLPELFGLRGLGRQNLSTGAVHWHRSPAGEAIVSGAVSRDNRMIAMLTTAVAPASGVVCVRVVDLLTGDERLLWSADGGVSAESGVGWSPSGDLISATYLNTYTDDDGDEEEEWTTAVIDLAGKVVATYPYSATLQAPNGAWLDDNQLIVYDDFEPGLRICQPPQGTDRRFSVSYGGAIATFGMEIICADHHGGHAPLTLAAARTEDGTVRELFQLTPNAQLQVLDVSGALDLARLADGPDSLR